MPKQASKQAADEQPAAKPNRLKPILIGLAGALLLVGASVGATVYLLGAGGAGEQAGTEEAEDLDRTPYYVELLDKRFTVNLAQGSDAKYIKLSMSALTYDPDVDTALRDHLPQLRGGLMLVLSSHKAQDIGHRQGREMLQRQALDKIRATLRQVGTGDAVEQVYFTSLVMQ